MDSVLKWKSNDDVKSLIDVILECKKELTTACFAKYGAARLVEFDVYASSKICKFIMLSGEHTPASDTRGLHWSKCVAKFEHFNLHRFKNVDDETVRVLVLFDSEERFPTLWYGNVLLT